MNIRFFEIDNGLIKVENHREVINNFSYLLEGLYSPSSELNPSVKKPLSVFRNETDLTYFQ